MQTNPLFSFRPSTGQIAAAESVFMCMAAVQTIRPIVENYQRKVLRDLGYGHTPLNLTYTLPDAVFAVFHERCQQEREAAGLHVDDPEFCPLLVAEHLLSQAQHLFVDVMEPVSGISFDQIFRSPNALDHYGRLVDLNLRLLAPYCKNRLKEV